MKRQNIVMIVIAVFVVLVVGYFAIGYFGISEEYSEIAGPVGYVDVSAMEAKELIDNYPDLIIIDVSPVYADGHLPRAVNYYIGDGSLDATIPTLDKTAMYLVYCHVFTASSSVAQKLVDAGFENVYRLDGEYDAWVDAGYEIVM
ncbi:MAG: rhodanese-like domain-containing protein [Candidatus Pacearchaeota archaeon]|nr:rhodanese-like domain-containing protein [Candidatus Pacearchaeota archaeon]